jgi:inositol 1,4,5-triphosphate receptor type 1/inositol 1,4,5-triphosphate receptor type 3
LKILKKIIEREEDKAKKVEMQNLFDRLGATQMVLLVLSDNSKYTDKKMLMVRCV